MPSRRASSRIPFRAVNCKYGPGHDPALQKHHLLPLALISRPTFQDFFHAIGIARVGFDDFRRNRMLLPCRERTVLRLGLPLHRGPHPRYSELVWQRVGQVERHWAKIKGRAPEAAGDEAQMRLALLQCALRKRLLVSTPRMNLNTRDPLDHGRDFTDLDRMAETLWQTTSKMIGSGDEGGYSGR